jgi:hypothetical protein
MDGDDYGQNQTILPVKELGSGNQGCSPLQDEGALTYRYFLAFFVAGFLVFFVPGDFAGAAAIFLRI